MFYNFRDITQNLLLYVPSLIDLLYEKYPLNKGCVISMDANNNSKIIKEKILDCIHNTIVYDLGIASTPDLADFSKKNKITGIQITASHLPEEYTGLKIFNNDGKSISVDEEKAIMALLTGDVSDKKRFINKVINCSNYKYKNELNDLRDQIYFPITWLVLEGTECFLPDKNKTDRIIFSKESDPEKRTELHSMLNENRILVSLDGDADKCIIYINGKRINESRIIGLVSLILNCKSVITNYEFSSDVSAFLEKRDIEMRYVSVGDQYIVDKMDISDPLVMGGEPNGHYILPLTTCSDAIKSALTFLRSHKMLDELPRVTQTKFIFSYDTERSMNIDLQKLKSHKYIEIDSTSFIIRMDDSDVFIRKSGWENSFVVIYNGNNRTVNNSIINFFGNGTLNRTVNYVED